MEKNILLINDYPGRGKVAIQGMQPLLSHLGYRVSTLPTALVSNTLDYGDFALMDTTPYIKEAMAVWDRLGFTFDAAAIGFLGSEEQGELIGNWLQGKDLFVLVDPIMGDEGKLYNGVSPERIETMRQLLSIGDLTVPNFTEACFLTGRDPKKPEEYGENPQEIIDDLRELGVKSVLISSMKTEAACFSAGYDHKTGEYFTVPYRPVDIHMPGTGDLFSAGVLGAMMEKASLKRGAEIASRLMETVMADYVGIEDPLEGIHVENSKGLLEFTQKL